MNRISTAGNYQSALLNLMSAQQQQNDAQNRVSTRKNATDMAGYGRVSESLTAMKSAQARVQSFADAGKGVADRLSMQDLALTQVGDGVNQARAAIANALAADSSLSVMQTLQAEFQTIQNGLNSKYHGNYLFAGADNAQVPVKVGSMAALAAAPDVASTFGNDGIATVSRLGETSTLQTGFLASDIGTETFEIFRAIQNYNDDPATGPLTGKLTEAQKVFLTDQMGRLEKASVQIVDVIARNGAMQKQVDSINESNEAQVASLEELLSNKTDADMLKAATDLQFAQIAVQASAKVVSQLNQVSLLNYLS